VVGRAVSESAGGEVKGLSSSRRVERVEAGRSWARMRA
jgi:hypothetical protein